MSDVVALVLFVVTLHGVLFIYWKGMAKARRKKYRKLTGEKD